MKFVPAIKVDLWAPTRTNQVRNSLSELEDFRRQVAEMPARFTPDEIGSVLDALAAHAATKDEWIENRDGWLRAGFAIHHQTEGSAEGFELWCEFAANSDKFSLEDSERVWRSMGRGNGVQPLTFRTLYMQAKRAGLAESYGFEPPPADGYDPLAGLEKLAKRDESKWRNELDLDDNDKIKASTTNIALILAHDPRLQGVIAQNDFTHEIVQLGHWGAKAPTMFSLPLTDPINGDLWTDAHDVNLIMFLSTRPQGREGGYGFKPSETQVKHAIMSAAMQARFHPVRDYLRSTPWDGRKRLDRLFVDYLETPDRPYFREAAALMMVAAVVLIFEPGHKFDFAAIIEGEEGRRKSTFIETIGAHWYGHLTGNFHDRKAQVEQMQGKWILEIPDLTGMHRSAVEDVKAFMSAGRDHVRLAYARRAGDFARQSVFWGTTNTRHYLESETGNRRFLPIPSSATTIDTDRLERNLSQLWAEAYARYRALRAAQPCGRLPLYLSGEAASDEAFQLQKDRKVESPREILAGRIEEWLATPITRSDLREDVAKGFTRGQDKNLFLRTRTCVPQVWDELLGNSQRQINSTEARDISTVLHTLQGWNSERRRFEFYGRQRYAVRERCTDAEIAAGVKVVPG